MYIDLSPLIWYETLQNIKQEIVMDSEAFQLTLEQQFQMRMMEESAHNMTHEQMVETLVQASRLLMVKDNMIRNLLKRCPI